MAVFSVLLFNVDMITDSVSSSSNYVQAILYDIFFLIFFQINFNSSSLDFIQNIQAKSVK